MGLDKLGTKAFYFYRNFSQFLVNGVIVEVRASTYVSDFPTYQELRDSVSMERKN